MSKNLIFLFFVFSLIDISKCQEFDKDMMRAVACISMIRKLENKPSDQRVLSSYILTCFITIDDETTQKLLLNQASSKLDLTQDQISKLTDMYKIENKYTEDQIMDYSKALNSALEKLKNTPPGSMRAPSQGGEFSTKSNNRPEGPGLLGRMISSLFGMFTSNDSLLILFGAFIIFYLILRQIRKWFGSNDKNVKNNVKKVTKNKKKVK